MVWWFFKDYEKSNLIFSVQNMTEHNLFKEISDEIKFDDFWDDIIFKNWYYEDTFIMNIVNLKQLIFNPKFMEKLRDYSYEKWDFDMDVVWVELYNHLDNPVSFLHKTIFS